MLSCTPAPIGPPIAGALAASSARVSGSNLPAFGLTGCAAPFSHFTASGSISQIFAARSRKRGDDLFGRLRHHDRGGEQHAAAAGQVGEADGRGVADQDRDAAVVDAEQLGADIGDAGARAADIGMAGRDHDVAVLGDVDLGARIRRRR